MTDIDIPPLCSPLLVLRTTTSTYGPRSFAASGPVCQLELSTHIDQQSFSSVQSQFSARICSSIPYGLRSHDSVGLMEQKLSSGDGGIVQVTRMDRVEMDEESSRLTDP